MTYHQKHTQRLNFYNISPEIRFLQKDDMNYYQMYGGHETSV